ncbi:dol-P-Glc:Glc(2)Man(9)GlcNAc(2)-PP-Dol alpha-1,2-glucosyltransferase isoform X2 [Serinus canaria]|uniref:dol-P-Glc:Glc(2)Man(9)GlcNAc(2)-PP-Dol alpha-1,2-glucosyltransferase isoform X2 n=1 Tax=Serinus canaria TaxID=9135 RepID=UPI0021CCE1C7|nr:dol-P-Glc:Glc(2)Man(9)GlcNAc(2)-PP-Dol alpha-1,2-glucosyltransferase isoform X2 [Serinus canaria]
MERAEAYGFSGAMSGAFLLSCLLFAAVSRRQRGPYMDEVFHVPQAQAYCHGRFLQWDPMITTLPGLYLLSVGVVKPAAWLLGWTGSVVCSVGMLRFINLLFSAGNFYLLYLLLFKIHQKNKAFGFGLVEFHHIFVTPFLQPLWVTLDDTCPFDQIAWSCSCRVNYRLGDSDLLLLSYL